jgi:hypothetical protein
MRVYKDGSSLSSREAEPSLRGTNNRREPEPSLRGTHNRREAEAETEAESDNIQPTKERRDAE